MSEEEINKRIGAGSNCNPKYKKEIKHKNPKAKGQSETGENMEQGQTRKSKIYKEHEC